uniref:Uncharacterized protein n=1 Tax=Setaria digitata TaxID=48799 RepID=A0A915Q499_9BILA
MFDSRVQRWVRSELKLFEIPRVYYAVINTGEHLFTTDGFNGAKYYRLTRRFSLNDQVKFAHEFYEASKRSGVGAAVIEYVAFICGGFDGTSRLQTCEFIDVREGKWHR